MRSIVWDADAAPEHHPDLLAVRVRPTLLREARRPHDTAAVRHLRTLEARGHLHGVHAMDGAPTHGTHGTLERALVRAARHHHEAHPHTGTLLVHLRHARHRDAVHARLRDDPHVEWATLVPARYLAGRPSPAPAPAARAEAPMPALRGWHHEAVRLADARAGRGFREPHDVTVTVLDTGVDTGHPALRGRITAYEHRFGAYHPGPLDIVGHGTHVSGIIAAGPNLLGATGMCRPRLIVRKIFSEETFAFDRGAAHWRMYLVDAIAYRAALQRCLHDGTQVLNLSIGGSGTPDPHESALLQALTARGVVVVAAMGNSTRHRERPSYPAAVPGVIAVGAVDPQGRVADFSCIGRHIALCAPGTDIWSTLPRQPGAFGYRATAAGRRAQGANPLARNVAFDAWPGTSMAAPQVTAAVAMLLATRGPMSPGAVRERLMRTATPLPEMRGKSFTRSCGAGRLDVARLISGRSP